MVDDIFFADPLGGLSDATWDAMAGDRFYSSSLWLRLCELAGGSVSGAVHIGLPSGGQAGMPIAMVEDEPNPHLRWHDLLYSRDLPAPRPGGLLVGQRRGYLGHVLSTPDADSDEAATAVLEAVRSVRAPAGNPRHSGRPDLNRVAMYLTTPDVLALRAAGVSAVPVVLKTDAWIGIPPGGWDAWLDALGSHRARRVRNEVRRFERAGYHVEQRSLRDCASDVGRLLACTEAKYGRNVDPAQLTRSFAAQGELAGDDAQVLLCRPLDCPAVGFCLFYRRGDTVYLRAIGFDYEQLRSAAEYFNLVYYIPARWPGVRWLHAGTETPVGKSLRGATLAPLWLLDLTEHSIHIDAGASIREHNLKYFNSLASSSSAVSRALDQSQWDHFF